MHLFDKNAEINPLTLSFSGGSGHLEPEYLDEHFKNSLTQIRIALLVGCSFYAVFGLLDAALVPAQTKEFWLIRYAVVCPLALSIYVFSFFPQFKRYANASLFLLCMVAGFGIVIMTAIAAPPANYSYYAGLILVFIYLFTFVKMGFLWAMAASWSIIVFYEIMAIYVLKAPFPILLNNNFFIIGSNLYCMIAGYSIEYFERKNFLLRRMLSDEKDTVARMNDALERKVMERTRDLETANRKIHEDADRRIQLETQLLQAQKMESVGRLAGGVAHDFNNMLAVIQGNAEIALDKVDRIHPVRHHLDQIFKTTQRSADLVRQLLAFARKQTIAPKVLNLNETIQAMLKMLQRLIGEDIDLLWRPGSDLWTIKMDPSQIDQVLANLCVNARDAISDVGKITIETENATIDERHCRDHGGGAPGKYVRLSVTDNGCGMDRETLEKIFDPFFTTKELGKGTGLGLATVYGIVSQNHGFIDVHSEPGQGTTFEIYLPRHEGESKGIPQHKTEQYLPSGHETILLVEDEPALLKMGKTMLHRFGYVVLTAGTPEEAIDLAGRHAGNIDLLMTDVIMPGMNGRDLARRLQTRYPALKAVFMSGYTADVIAHHGIPDKGVQFIQKPFSMEALAVKVREALGGENEE